MILLLLPLPFITGQWVNIERKWRAIKVGERRRGWTANEVCLWLIAEWRGWWRWWRLQQQQQHYDNNPSNPTATPLKASAHYLFGVLIDYVSTTAVTTADQYQVAVLAAMAHWTYSSMQMVIDWEGKEEKRWSMKSTSVWDTAVSEWVNASFQYQKMSNFNENHWLQCYIATHNVTLQNVCLRFFFKQTAPDCFILSVFAAEFVCSSFSFIFFCRPLHTSNWRKKWKLLQNQQVKLVQRFFSNQTNRNNEIENYKQTTYTISV